MWGKLLASALQAIVGSAVRAAAKVAPETYRKVRNWWNGKAIAIIGPTASGKNSMFQKLKRKDVPLEHVQTRGAEKVAMFKFYWPLPDQTKIEFRCKGSLNVGGEVDERERYWLQSCKDADVIFYLVDIEKLIQSKGTYLKRIKDDFKWITSNLPSFRSNAAIHIFINKVDTTIHGVPVEAVEQHVKQNLAKHVDDIETAARSILRTHFARVSGISPISMTDSYLFSIYFTEALKSISISFKAEQ